ncbi:MAG: DUF4446 family protein [Patescibacteria group bacterium]
MTAKIEIIFLIVSGLAILVGIVWIVKTEKRLNRFFMGKKASNLEDTINLLQEEIVSLKASRNVIEKELTTVNTKLKQSIRGVETIRFNPFPDQGSNQSFAIAMLNEENNGVVISSLYSRERMSIFAKPIKNGKSEYELTNEEKEALAKSEIK